MFIYLRKTDDRYGEWDVTTDHDPDNLKSAKHVTVYRYSDQYDPKQGLQKDISQLKMLGDFVIDIDAQEITTAIDWTRKLLTYLRDDLGLDLNFIKIYASGSKGFHITIPQKFFDGAPKPTVRLNQHHGYMASFLSAMTAVPFDMGMYAIRHLLRTPGQRGDGRWKNLVTPEQVFSWTANDYNHYAMEHRTLEVSHLPPPKYLCPGLNRVWEDAKAAVKEQVQHNASFSSVADELLDVFDDNTIPTCIEWMRTKFNIAVVPGLYNRIAMNVAPFLGLTSEVSDKKKEELLTEISNAYATRDASAQTRRIQLVSKLHQVETGGLHFKCGANRSVLTANPCSGCALQKKIEETATADTSITSSSGYLQQTAKGADVRLTNFTVNLQRRIYELREGKPIIAGEECNLEVFSREGVHEDTILIPISDWASISAFRSSMLRYGGQLHFTSEVTLAAIRAYITGNSSQLEGIMKTELCGINIAPAKDGTLAPTWVEPGWLISGGGNNNPANLVYVGNAGHTIQSMRGLKRVRKGDPEINVMEHLLKSNDILKVGSMLGWACACHMKEHLAYSGYTQFPLLHIAGMPGSGKTMSAIVYGALTGAKAEGPMTVGSSTLSPMRQALSQTTTVARVYDEFNKQNLPQDKYLRVVELLKSAYVRQNVSIGTIGSKRMNDSTAAMLTLYATAPIIYMSKEATENEELQQRSIIVQVDKRDNDRLGYAEHFKVVHRSAHDLSPDGSALQQWCRTIMAHVLDRPIEYTLKLYEGARADITLEAHDRKLVNLTTVLTGIRLFKDVVSDISEALQQKAQEIEDALMAHWHEDALQVAVRSKRFGPIEQILKTLETISRIGNIQNNVHYIIQGKTLHVDPAMCFMAYRRYCSETQTIAEVQSIQSLEYMLRNCDYIIGEGLVPGKPHFRNWVALDLTRLEEADIYADSFTR